MFRNAEYAGGKSSKFIILSVKSTGIQLKTPDKTDKIGCLSVPSKMTHFTHFTYKFGQLKILGHGDDKGRLHVWLKKTRQEIKPEP